jgi:4-hydroxy-tetrahydrodipicolinate synthase
MPVPFKPEGVWTAIVTPFDKKGVYDPAAFKRLVEFQTANGITGIVPTGTTGESPTLSWDEHNRIVEDCAVFAREQCSILAGTGSNSTEEAIDATRHARESGASGALLVDCYYNAPSSLELRTEYYEQIASWVSDFPLVPYVIPGRSSTALAAEDLALLHISQPTRFVAVKQATGDLERMRRDRNLCGDSLAIMSGDDDLTLTMMKDDYIRASGVISVMSNLVPGPLKEMVNKFRSGDEAGARLMQAQLDPLFKMVGCKASSFRKFPDGRTMDVEDKFRNPSPVKTMMAGLGMPVGGCRRPLGKMSRPAVEFCRAALRKVHDANGALLEPVGQFFGVNIWDRLNDDALWAGLARE